MAESNYKEVQQAVENIVNIKTSVKRKKRSESEKKRELFVTMINSLEEILSRSKIMILDLKLDFFNYDEKFMQVIDGLFYMNFGNEGSDIITYYLYDRMNEDGSINPLRDESGQEVILNSPYELWNLLLHMNPKIEE